MSLIFRFLFFATLVSGPYQKGFYQKASAKDSFFSPPSSTLPSQALPLHFFDQSFEQAHNDFSEQIKRMTPHFSINYKEFRFPQPKSDLFISAAKINNSKSHLIVLVSGVHGAEAPAGSAIQRLWLRHLETLPPQGPRASPSWLIIHGLNPSGFQQKRRVNENNVDLNRSFLIGDKHSLPLQNRDYQRLESFLNPKGPASHSAFSKLWFYLKSIVLALSQGIKTVRSATLSGQYEFPEGIYFGGSNEQPSATLYRQILHEMAQGYEHILFIDLHTGYGERGRLHFFSDAGSADELSTATKSLFNGFPIDFGGDKNFYKTTGSIGRFTEAALKGQKVHTMTFEFGTQNSQTLLGSIYSLRTLVWENQAFHFTTPQEDKQRIQNDFQALFNPSDPKWRSQVYNQALSALNILSAKFLSLSDD